MPAVGDGSCICLDSFPMGASTRSRRISTRCSRWPDSRAWTASLSMPSWTDATRCPLAAVPVHGVIAAVHAGDPARVVLAHLLLQLFEIAGAASGQRVASVHEGMDKDAVHALLSGHLEQRVEMRLLRVDAPIGNESKQMQLPSPTAGMLHGRHQRRVGEEVAVVNQQVDAGDVHVHDAPGADIQMADFAVAHLPFRQTNERAAGVDQSVGILAQQPVVGRLARQRDGIGFGPGAVTPAIKDDEDERFGTVHGCRLAPGYTLMASHLPMETPGPEGDPSKEFLPSAGAFARGRLRTERNGTPGIRVAAANSSRYRAAKIHDASAVPRAPSARRGPSIYPSSAECAGPPPAWIRPSSPAFRAAASAPSVKHRTPPSRQHRPWSGASDTPAPCRRACRRAAVLS